MLVAACAMADVCTKLHTERCPSHKGQLHAAHPQQLQPSVFCESHFDCHVFAFISFPALYMTHPQQDGGARAELGCPGAAFLTHQPCFGQLSGRQSHGEERFSRLQELTCCACVSWAECSFAGQGCKGSHTLPIQETEMLFPLESDGGSFHLLRVWTLPFSIGYPLSILPQVWYS